MSSSRIDEEVAVVSKVDMMKAIVLVFVSSSNADAFPSFNLERRGDVETCIAYHGSDLLLIRAENLVNFRKHWRFADNEPV
jgi:hypothetical protein